MFIQKKNYFNFLLDVENFYWDLTKFKFYIENSRIGGLKYFLSKEIHKSKSIVKDEQVLVKIILHCPILYVFFSFYSI